MSRLVIDASVLAKLFLEEVGSREARAAVRKAEALLAPDLLWAEIGNVLWKYVRRGELTPADAELILADMLQTPIAITPSAELVELALRIGAATDRTVDDALYVATAVRSECKLLTADHRLANALAPTPFAKHVRRITKLR